MLICIIGKSCSGKTTLANYISKKYNIKKVITSTSRSKRDNEIDGVDYNFFNYERMRSDINSNKYVESCEFNRWLYGTRYEDIDINSNQIIVVNPTGFKRLKEVYKDNAIGIYIKVPLLVRIKRILSRDKKDYKEAVRRFFADERDFFDIEDKVDVIITKFELNKN